jgi:hypothetical protein
MPKPLRLENDSPCFFKRERCTERDGYQES